MARILAIDDDENTCALVETTLSRRGYEVHAAMSGVEGLKALQEFKPDALVIDKMMPGMDGYELVRRIRQDVQYGQLPILILTAEADLEGKVHAFEVGADDYLNKPFAPDELTARMAALLRRAHAANGSAPDFGAGRTPRMIAVHTLRGGIGATTLAVNLAVALRNLWSGPTLLADLVSLSGHVNLFLDKRVKHTWASLQGYALEEIDDQVMRSLVHDYENGLEFIAAPQSPSEAELVAREAVAQGLGLLKSSYDYIVVDLPHDFGEVALEILDQADVILTLVAPDLASLRAASLTLDTYSKLDYDLEKVQLVLNRPFAEQGVAPMDIFRVLKHSMALELPYAGARCVQAINNGEPLVSARPEHEMSQALEDYAFDISKLSHREFPPIVPTTAWQRVHERRNPTKLLTRVGRIFQ